MRKKAMAIGLVLILLLLPLAVRWFYFYEGRYEPGEVPRPDVAAIDAPVPVLEPFVDHYGASEPGIILVDLAHGNRFDMAELNVLQARLAARGQQIESVETASDLQARLHYAKALVVIAPGEDWTPDEVYQVREFVDKGGRLLLVTDPTRFDVLLDEWGNYVGLDHDVAHINYLATRFGLIFQPDYLYNTVEHESNFRNIELSNFATHDLTRELEKVVFYAAHSIISDEPALITADGETYSSSSEGADELTVAVLAAEGAVLGLGDLTFMTEPYNAVYDNYQLIANIADFLSGVQREYELADFPYFFDDEVDLIYAGDPLLDSSLLVGGRVLQDLFDQADKKLTVREEEDKARDTLFLGLYEETEEVEPYLAAAQVTVLITDTQGARGEELGESRRSVEEMAAQEKEAEAPSVPSTKLSLTATTGESLTSTPAITLTKTPDVAAQTEITVTAEVSPAVKNRVKIESLGEMVLTGTSLLILQTDSERRVLVVLADSETGVEGAIKRLAEGDLDGCLLHEIATSTSSALALCPTAELEAGKDNGGWQAPEPEQPPELIPAEPAPSEPVTKTVEPPGAVDEREGSIFVIAVDEGEGRYDGMTSADEYAAILGAWYDVKIWSMAQDGLPDASDLLDYDLVIWTAGDYIDAFGSHESDLFLTLMLEGIPMILSGAYIGDAAAEAVQRDIQVNNASHPMASGFAEGEVIAFVPAPSGQDYETGVIDDMGEGESTIVFIRGPDSEATGAPSVFVLEDDFSGVQIAFINFPLYLLPEAAKSQLLVNTVDWMLAP